KMNQVVNYAINFGTGNGGYDDGGNPIIDSKNMIQFDTKFTDWDAETPIDPTPKPIPPVEEAKMSFGIKAKASAKFALPFLTSSTTGNYTLTVDWGDETAASVIEPETSLAEGITHTYAEEGEYTVTITSSETDFTKPQVPQISFTNWSNERGLLKSINTPLLNTGSLNLSRAFQGCSNLEKIPEDLLKYNTRVTDFSYFLSTCQSLVSVPEKLFEQNVDATNFSSLLEYCSALQMIPENLFANNGEATDFSYSFYACAALKSIPGKLFTKNVKATTFNYTFFGGSALEVIPAGLFAENRVATIFGHTFNYCEMAKVSPLVFGEDLETRFSSVPGEVKLDYLFGNVGARMEASDIAASVLPALWTCTYPHGETHYGCFYDSKASNSDEANKWK
ncbi:MAG: hypothetical protein ACRCZZ_10705, partial [Phocaeicola sp.]